MVTLRKHGFLAQLVLPIRNKHSNEISWFVADSTVAEMACRRDD